MNETRSFGQRALLFAEICGLFIAAVVLTGLLTPWIYNVLIWLGRSFELLQFLRNLSFERVASRCLLLAFLVASVLMIKVAGLRGREHQGFARGTHWLRSMLIGVGLGLVSLGLMLVVAWGIGAYTIEPFTSKIATRIGLALITGLTVGYLEEWLFRGVIFGAMREAIGVWSGAVLASLLFAAIHFAKPDAPFSTVKAGWDSAFRLMPYCYTWQDFYWPYEGYKIYLLFFMGLTMCFLYARYGSVYLCIGLHAGWVWAMRAGDFLFDERVTDIYPRLFGPTPGVVKSGVALIVSVVFCAASMALYVRRPGRIT